jgi:GxxExxY protein
MGLIYKNESYQIVGAAQEVHRTLGAGFLEKVYQEAFELELKSRGIEYQREVGLSISYKNEILQAKYKADFICFDKIIIELKALNELTNDHTAQVINYLKVTNFKLGILINFGSSSLQSKRLVN